MTHADPPGHPSAPVAQDRKSAPSLMEGSPVQIGSGAHYLYAVVRKEMTGGALLAQFGHAVTECLGAEDLPLPSDTRIVVLGATKEQLKHLSAELERAGIRHRAILETDGPLAGCVTAIGLLTKDRDSLRGLLGELRPWRGP